MSEMNLGGEGEDLYAQVEGGKTDAAKTKKKIREVAKRARQKRKEGEVVGEDVNPHVARGSEDFYGLVEGLEGHGDLNEGERGVLKRIIDYFSNRGLFPHPAEVRGKDAEGRLAPVNTTNGYIRNLREKGYISRRADYRKTLVPVGVELVARFTDDEAGRKLALALGMPVGDWSK